VVELATESIVEKGRLGPGQMIAVDLQTQEILKNWDIRRRVALGSPMASGYSSIAKPFSPSSFKKSGS
jgi:glutamate synthase (ferredoxin)